MSGESEAKAKGNESNQTLKSLGKYVIERKLGQGGMGTVYLAHHADLKRRIALKVLPRDKAQNPTLVRRFKAEAQAAAHLEHPNIVAVYDTGEADGYLYITMEYVDGIDLFEYLKRRKTVPVKRSIEIIKQAAAALQHAYEQNIVHRDIKPSNLMLRRDGVVKLTDLGLARSVDETLETNITRAGTTVGTVDYMAPEQARNSKSADIRSDIYSLGCTWYQMLTSQPPFPDGSMMNKLAAHAVKPLPDPRALNEAVPEGIYAILQRMTAKKPDDRYQTPAELIEDINRSKLTKAAFSNEILSDLNDDDADVSSKDANDDDEADEAEDEFQPRDRTGTLPARRTTRSRLNDDDGDGEPLPREGKRKKTRPEDASTNVTDSTQPLKSRSRQPTKEPDSDVETPASKASRTTNASAKSGASSKSKSSGRREGDSSPATSARKPPSGSHEPEKLQRGGTKPLPPKRSPADEEPESPSALDPELLRRIGIAAGVIGVVCALGGLFFYWAGQLDMGHSEVQTAPPVVTPQPQLPVQPQAAQSIESNATNFADHPAVDSDFAKQPLPSWATTDVPLPKDLPTYVVGTGSNATPQYTDINEALRAVGAKGGIIALQGNGPFLLTSAELKSVKKLIITAARAEDQPLIVVKPAESGSTMGLTVSNGELDLRGLHFVLNQSAGTTTNSGSMISVNDGQLFVRRCSFTAMNGDGATASALTFNSQHDSTLSAGIEPLVLIDRVVIRGNGLTGLQIQRTLANVVIQDSLFATGTAPAIDVTGRLAAETIQDKPRRVLRVLRSTLCARNHLFVFSTEGTVQPPLTAVLLQDSVCSAEGSGNNVILVSATHWPSVSNPSGWLTNLSWTSVASLYLGFEELIELDRTYKSYKVTDADSWQRVWGAKRVDANQFQRLHWQESMIPDLSSVQPGDFDNAKLIFQEVKTSSGSLPGCLTNRVRVPLVISQSRLQAMSLRAKVPPAVNQALDVSQARKVDLTKDDLGVVLSRSDWPSGTVFEVSGFGLRTMSSARISDKSVQIVFRQSGEVPLRIQPKTTESKSRVESQGLFSIENGTLELHSAILESNAGKGVVPWLINAKDASVVIKGCQLSCSLQQDVEQHAGLIQWSSRGASSVSEPPFLSVSDSLLMSTGVGVRVELAQGSVFLRNSIIAVRGYGVSVMPGVVETASSPTIDINHVSFSASKAAVRVEAPTDSGPVNTPLRMFVENSVVVAPLEFKEGESTNSAVVEIEGAALDEKQIEWWGNANGFSSEVHALLRRPNADPVTAAAGWESAWGDASEIRLLTGPKSVQLLKPLPNKWTNLKASSFTLDPDSPSAKWAEGSRPLGANIRVVEEALVLKKQTKDSKPGSPGGKKPPGGQTNNPNAF